MRRSHYWLFGVAVAALGYVAISPGAAHAQYDDAMSAGSVDPAMNEEQRAEHDSWPEEKQAAYAAWPRETQAYYWSLNPERQMLFWALADSDKIALTAMTGPEREDAWERIEAQAGAASDPA